jgi:hypothetical protein
VNVQAQKIVYPTSFLNPLLGINLIMPYFPYALLILVELILQEAIEGILKMSVMS